VVVENGEKHRHGMVTEVKGHHGDVSTALHFAACETDLGKVTVVHRVILRVADSEHHHKSDIVMVNDEDRHHGRPVTIVDN